MSILRRAFVSSTVIASLGLGYVGVANAADDFVYASQPAGNPWYFEARLGGPLPRSYDVTGSVVGSYDPDPGFMFAGNIGKYFTPNVRADIGVSYGWGTDGNFTLAAGGAPIPHTGRASATTILGNAYYEFNNFGVFTPWIGAGLGATIFNYDSLGGGGFQFNDSATAFTAAAHLGADYALNDMVDLTGRYSLSWTGSHSISNTTAGPVPITVESQVNNTFTVGFRFKFGG